MEFEWDTVKAKRNLMKHGVQFSEAVTIWLDSNSLEIHDLYDSSSEERWIRIGLSRNAHVLVVVYTEMIEETLCRIISARKATRAEAKQYFEDSYEKGI